jgi:iron(III) transport system substrate-binding protein
MNQRIAQRCGWWAAAAAVLAAVVMPPARAASGPATLTVDHVIEAARREGRVLVSDSSPEPQFTRVIAAFRQKYGFLEVQQLSQSSAEAIGRMTQEVSAGRPTTSDVVIGGLAQLSLSEKQGLLQQTPWASMNVTKELIQSPRQVKVAGALTVLVYNRAQVAENDAPRSWEDLLADRWRGKVAIFPAGDIGADLSIAWNEQRATDFWTRLVQQSTLISTPPEVANRVAAGEFAIGVVRVQHARAQQARGAPVGFRIPNPAIYSVLTAVIPKNASHPNAGRLYIAWLSSTEGANIYERATLRGNPFVSGSDAANDVRGLTLVSWNPRAQNVEERGRLEQKFLQLTQRR